ncbi:ran-binding protein 3 isoform X3 [Rattus norvegicus]|uniref:Ran-binding protein 3 n=1 Tax=Rattus norvegicus TaxID=10116 RepID=M0R920_RAT|nr:ran-binding protein 3 isoform X3 [Rattus norvegicus]|eukprot:XP_006244421.1 PREDICTED: ran-binding protein 3 isoform X3 [Rattus norvegicus]
MADLANEEKPAVAPSVFVFQKDKGQKSSTEHRDLPESGEEPQGEAEAPRPDAGYPESTGEHALDPSAPASASTSSPPLPAPAAQPPCVQELSGRSAGSSSPEAGEDSDHEDGNYCPPVKRERTSSLTHSVPSSGTNGVSMPADCTGPATSASPENLTQRSPSESAEGTHTFEEKVPQKTPSGGSEETHCEEEQVAPQAFVFGQNLRDRVKLMNEKANVADVDSAAHPGSETPTATNYFLQYISSSADNSTHSADTSTKFVFGQNMSERVLSPPKLNEANSDTSRETTHAQSGSESSSQEAVPKKESLAESAAAYTKATAWTCLLEKVEVITGEEAESNVLQIQCKLFVFDKTSQSWVERGRGLLRLNDMASADDGTLQSRLVMRTQGSLRLILNTKLWAQMQMDKASEKSIRITATDAEDQGVKVFLISASSKDTGQLYAALHHRILALRSRAEQEQEAKAPPPEPGATRAAEEEDSDEDAVLAPSGVTGAGAGDDGDGQATGST